MKLLKTITAVSILLVLFFRFTAPAEKDSILGVWVQSNYTADAIVYKKDTGFHASHPGLEFQENGVLIRRQNYGWCGTPPISYTNVTGSWKRSSDSTITLNYTFWAGNIEEELLIVKQTPTELTLKSIKQNVEEIKAK